MDTSRETRQAHASRGSLLKNAAATGPEATLARPGATLHTLLLYTACGTFLYAICAGFRDNYGIMLPYIVGFSGISYATVSLIIALGQLLFGAMQLVFGLLALRTGARFTLYLGVLMMLAGLLLIPFSTSAPMLTLSLGVLLPSGTAAASFGMIMGLLSPKFSTNQAHTAAGFVAAGIGMGICFLSPVIQSVIAAHGLFNAVLVLTAPLIMLFPVSYMLTRDAPMPRKAGQAAGVPAQSAAATADGPVSVKEMFRQAFLSGTYRRLTLGFFTCGFHMAMIQTHLFSQLTNFGVSERAAAYAISTYGIGVICGGVGSGQACARFSMSRVASLLYASRCLWVVLLLLPLPLPVLFAVIFMLGATGPATIAPTSGMVQKLFGSMRLPTLFGFVYLMHQIGAFCSAWAGGLCRQITGSYSGVWYADIALCFIAAIACWGIKKE